MKKNLLRVLICILAVSALFCAFAVMANAEGEKPIYISRIGNGDGNIDSVKYNTWNNTLRIYLTPEFAGTETDGVFDKRYNFGMKTTVADGNITVVNGAFYPIGQDLSQVAENLVESGLYYTFDSTSGKMTITGSIKKQSDGKDVPWIIPAINGSIAAIKEVEIAEDTGVTRLFDHCMNNCNVLRKVTIPSTVNTLENESLSRTYGNLVTIKVWGSEFETGLDLRNVTKFYDVQTFLESLRTGATFYINEFLMGCRNVSLGGKTYPSTMIVYAPKVESCLFATTLATGVSGGTQYTVEMFPMSTCAVKQLGYQIRTENYNGLRSRFVRDNPFGLRIANSGTVLETPEVIAVPSSEGTTVEYGVIVATNDLMNSYGYELTKNGSAYETSNAKIKKIAVDSSKVDVNGYFYVSVVNYVTKAQMESKIHMVPYEIKRDGSGNETVVYGTSLEASSIYDATIGLYTKGLINASVEKDNVFWSVLDKCKYTDINLTTEGQELLTANGKTWAYSVNSDGDLVTTAGGVPLSVFQLSDGTFTAIAHKSSKTTSTTFTGSAFATSDWKVETNQLSPFFLGFPIKTIIVEHGITQITQDALKGYYDHTEGATEVKPTLEYVIYADTVKTFGGANKSKRIKTIVPFSKSVTFTDSDWAAYDGIYDLSGFTTSCATKYVINQSKVVKGIIYPASSAAPKALDADFLCDSSTTFQYIVGAGNTPTLPVSGAKTYDLRGTGLYVPFDLNATSGSYETTKNTFKGMWPKYIIQDELVDGEIVTYKYTVTKSSSSPYTATREVYSAS